MFVAIIALIAAPGRCQPSESRDGRPPVLRGWSEIREREREIPKGKKYLLHWRVELQLLLLPDSRHHDGRNVLQSRQKLS